MVVHVVAAVLFSFSNIIYKFSFNFVSLSRGCVYVYMCVYVCVKCVYLNVIPFVVLLL